jgi:hypothetical protein
VERELGRLTHVAFVDVRYDDAERQRELLEQRASLG